MTSFKRALRYLPRYRREVAIGLLSIPVSQALSMAIPWIIGHGIDELRAGSLSLTLPQYFSVILGLAAMRGITKYTMRYFIVGASRRMEEDLRNDLLAHLLRVAPDRLATRGTGDVMTRLTWDVEAVRMFLGPGVMYLTETLLILPPALCVLAMFDKALAAAMLVPLLLIVLTMKLTANPVHVESQLGQERLSDLSDLAQESFSGVRVVRSFAREQQTTRLFADASAEYAQQMVRVARIRGMSWTLMMAAKDLGVLLLVSAGCIQMIRGAISVGNFLIFNMYLGLLFWPMVALGWMIAMYQRAKVSMQRIEELLDQPIAIPVPEHIESLTPVIRGDIEFRGLTVERGGQRILSDIHLHIPAGTVLGVTGAVGSGKSTLIQALLRLVDIPPGTVFLDGVDICRIDIERLRHCIGFVPQDAFLFAETIAANLSLGAEGADEPALTAALKAAQVDQEVASLRGGIQAVVGERGVTLSGGQRQRITIARALLKDPAVLAFDDCLSAVDAETEVRLLAELRTALRGRTAIVVSHRLSTLGLADTIVVMHQGRAVEHGSVPQLLAQKGLFHALYQRQKSEAELEQLS